MAGMQFSVLSFNKNQQNKTRPKKISKIKKNLSYKFPFFKLKYELSAITSGCDALSFMTSGSALTRKYG